MSTNITFLEFLQGGVWMLVPISIFFLISLIISIVKLSELQKEQRPVSLMKQRLRDYIVEGDLENARQLCSSNPTAAGAILYKGVSHIGYPLHEIGRAMSETYETERIRLKRGTGWLKTMGIASILAGAFGSLTGIAIVFISISADAFIYDWPRILREIGVTLITFSAGLGVGLISLVLHKWLIGAVTKTLTMLKLMTVEFLDLLNEPS